MKENIEKRLKEIEAGFPKLQQQLEEKRLEVIKIQGEYEGLKKLLDGDKVVDMKK